MGNTETIFSVIIERKKYWSLKKNSENIVYLKKELNTIKTSREKNYTIKTKLDQYGNWVLIFEAVKDVDEEIVTKEINILLTRDPTPSLLSGNVAYSDEMNNSLII